MPPGPLLVEVWERNKPILKSIARNILIDHSLVDDVLQDAFTQILQSGREFETEREVYNYIRRAVINMSIDYYRHLRGYHSMLQSGELSKNPVDAQTPLMVLVRNERDQLEGSIMEVVRAVVSRLAPEQQQAIELVFGRTNRLKAICRETGIPYSTLRSRVLSAVEQIRRQLRARGLLTRQQEEEPEP